MVKENMRFALIDGYRSIGQYIVKNDVIYEVIVHITEDGVYLDYETTRLVTKGFVYEYSDTILQMLSVSQIGDEKELEGYYIHILNPCPLKECMRDSIKTFLSNNDFEWEENVLRITVDCEGSASFPILIELISKNIEQWTYGEFEEGASLKIDIDCENQVVRFNL